MPFHRMENLMYVQVLNFVYLLSIHLSLSLCRSLGKKSECSLELHVCDVCKQNEIKNLKLVMMLMNENEFRVCSRFGTVKLKRKVKN